MLFGLWILILGWEEDEYIHVCIQIYVSIYIHTHNIVFQSEFTPKQTSLLVSLCQWVDFSSYTFLSSRLSLYLDKIQSPARPCANWPSPPPLGSSATIAFPSLPMHKSSQSLLFLKHVQGYVAVPSHGMSFLQSSQRPSSFLSFESLFSARLRHVELGIKWKFKAPYKKFQDSNSSMCDMCDCTEPHASLSIQIHEVGAAFPE